MRLIALILATCLPTTAFSQDSNTIAEDGSSLLPASGIMFSTSISINLPLGAVDQAGKQAEEDAYRSDLYQRSVNECDVLLETIAKRCEITSVNISTQINSNPGQADYLYASANITLQVELK
jgi:hypothetical protein